MENENPEDKILSAILGDAKNTSERFKNSFRDSKVIEEKLYLNEEQSEYHKELIEDLRSDRKLRESYAEKVFGYLIVYSVIVALIIFMAGFGEYSNFKIEVPVLTTIVGSTAVAAIGLVLAVVRGLFPSNGRKNGDER